MSPLITCSELAARMRKEPASLVVVDCSFDLSDQAAGLESFKKAHIPRATYLHLEDEMSARRTGINGRHPLPARGAFVQTLTEFGVSDDSLVVAYDTVDARYAARLWWMVRWIGHASVCVLDGGLCQWRKEGLPLEAGAPARRARGNLSLRPSLERVVGYEDVRANLETRATLVIDARARDRFRGENETLDPIGGHILGARNRPYRENLNAGGTFREPRELREDFERVIAGYPATHLIHQCGSGVTSCHNRLAMEVAGFPSSAMYVGSWSEWCVQPDALMVRDAGDEA